MAMVNGVTVPDLDLDRIREARELVRVNQPHDPQYLLEVLGGVLTQYDNLAGRVAILAANVQG